jgi:RNA polymerase sigma factor (sigma-70 family)
MSRERGGKILGHFQTLFATGTSVELTDGELLRRFAAREPSFELAFTLLVDRHGAMVLRACRALLRDSHEAHDAFQVTFLVLARKAGSIQVRDSLGPWLHRVALRTSSHLLSTEARRRRHERIAAEVAARTVVNPPDDDLGVVIRDEVNRLPERYRAAVVSCLLEGLTPEQAALLLHCPVGTVHSRLARGRKLLRDRLERRGLAPPERERRNPSVDQPEAARAMVPVSLSTSTIQAATRYVTSGQAAGAIAAPVAGLLEGVLRMMFVARLKLAAALILAVGTIAIGVGFAANPKAVGHPKAEGPQPTGWLQAGTPQTPAAQTGDDAEGTARARLIEAAAARSTAIRSGRFNYHLKVEIADQIERDGDYQFSFSGDDWMLLDLKIHQKMVNHDGRLMTYTETPQPDGRISRWLRISFSESPFARTPCPPIRVGTIWNSATRSFVLDRAKQARSLGAENVNGVETTVLEWDVPVEDRYLAFEAIPEMLKEGGKLRIYVAPQLGHATPRIDHLDRFGTVQDRFEYSEFQEAAPTIFVPAVCENGVGVYKSAYRLTKVEDVNRPIPAEEFVLSIPSGTSVQDERPRSKDTVDEKGQRTYHLEDYPFRSFRTEAAYPTGFPPELLKELDRDVERPAER